MNKTKKMFHLFRWAFWVKTGVDLLFFTLKVDCAYSKHCKNSKVTEYVARFIFKHPVKFEGITSSGKKLITVYLTPQRRRDFQLFD